jgi:hypothetical protein
VFSFSSFAIRFPLLLLASALPVVSVEETALFSVKNDQQRLFILKMQVEGAHRNIGDLDDLADRGLLVATDGKHLAGGREQVRPHTRPSSCDSAW